MTIIEGLRSYISEYSGLAGGKLHVDFLPGDENSYSIEVTPGDPIVKQYCDGSSRRQMEFSLASNFAYSNEILHQMSNLNFFEDFQAWLEARNRSRDFPDLGTGRKCVAIEATTCGYVFTENADFAWYQIQMKMTYVQEGL